MGAAMIGTMYFLRANCAQHGGSASGGGLIRASLLSYRALIHCTLNPPYSFIVSTEILLREKNFISIFVNFFT